MNKRFASALLAVGLLVAAAGYIAREATAVPSTAPVVPTSKPATKPAAKPATKPAAPKEVVLDLGNNVKMKLVLIPAGKFLMGSPKDEKDRIGDDGLRPGQWVNEEPRVEVTITKPFYLGVTEVTQAQWKAVMGNNPSLFKGDDRPVEHVSWNDAVAFCEKLSKKEGKRFRLPTEAEWEYACRAGSQTRFAFGDNDKDLLEYAWCLRNSRERTSPVGKKKPNAWGLYDMHGNVSEWCADYYADGYPGPGADPTGPKEGRSRVMRGGSLGDLPAGCRSANRYHAPPEQRGGNVGIRLVLDPQ